MALSSIVNQVLYELEKFESKIGHEKKIVLHPKFTVEADRIRAEVNYLHQASYHIDLQTHQAGLAGLAVGYELQEQATNVTYRAYILRNQIGFAKNQLDAYIHLNRHPPQKSTIFSSPSHSGSASPERDDPNSSQESVYWFSPKRLRN